MLLELLLKTFEESGVRVHSRLNNTISIRCKFCGDSVKNINHSHLYISEKEEVLVYYCQRCHSKGLVNYDFLHLYEQNPTSIINIINNYPKYNFKKQKLVKENKYDIKIVLPSVKTDYYDKKMIYYNKRTGKSYKNYELDKIVFSLKDLIRVNKDLLQSENFNIHPYYLDILDKNYIGFLNHFNNKIILRRVTEDKNLQRFRTLTLFKDNTTNFYNSNYNCIEREKRVNINFCEGIFDCINLRSRLSVNENDIFIAVLNKDYTSKINFILAKFGLKINKINFYLDQDHNYYEQFKNIGKNELVSFYKNSLNKDYGEIEEEMKLKKVKIFI